MANRNKNKQNVRNDSNPLYKKLTKLLSGPIVRYRRQDAKQLKRRQLDKYSSRFKSSGGQEFKLSTYSDIYGMLQAEYYSNQNRMDRYVDFDQMEYTPEIASALDIYADEMTTSSRYMPILNINCTNGEIKSILETLFYNVLNIEFNLFGWARSMCKYGDFFLYLDIEEDEGIKNAIGMPITEVERLEGEDKSNPNYIQFQWNTGGLTLENWQVAHFRILGNDKFVPYGTSALDASRRIWRQLTLLEDAVMAYRIVRSPERRLFKIDVGNIPPEDVEQYMQKVMTQMKRNQIVDASTGRVDLRYNPLSIEEDYYIPVRGGQSGTSIETVGGGKYTGDIEDVKYLRDKLFAALKIPASYLSRGDGADEDKATLAQKDIRFARTIQRLQRSLVSELEKIAIVHLFTLGYRGNDILSFKLSLNNPSKLAELQELEHWKARFAAAGEATEGYFSRRWVAKNILAISEEEFQRMQLEKFYDKKHDISLEKVGEQAEAEAGAGGGGGMGDLGDLGGGGDMGDLGDVGGEDLGGAGGEGGDLGGEDIPAAPEAEAPAPGGEEGGELLATPAGEGAPAKRDSIRHYEKGNYKAKGQSGKSRGGFTRSQQGMYSKETSSNTVRNLYKGKQDLDSLIRISHSLSEGQAPNYYETQEKQLFKENFEIKKLIESLEKSHDEI